MSEYRRIYIPGGTYFFTLVTHKRQPILCSEQAISRLRTAFNLVKKKYPFHLQGLVVLPDHLHCIWGLPENDFDYSKRWKMIKHYFSTGMQTKINYRHEKAIWQKRFWEHLIRDEYDLEKHMDYIYYNPVKHGYVDSPSDWLYSTFKRAVEKGLYPRDWGSYREPKKIINMDYE